jgi:DNA-binding NtrC family response regulator
MDHVREAIARLSTHPGPILVRGEPGTGKSLVAGALGSATAEVVDCHRARKRRKAIRMHPTGAVVVIDEVGDAGLELQRSLIDLVRDRGSALRVIATTSRDVERFAEAGNLHREFLDLFAGATIWLPPLRTRRSDVPELAEHFLGALPGRELDVDALPLLERQAWPGNVRQLREAIRRLALLHDRITSEHVEYELRTMRAEATRTNDQSVSARSSFS